MASHRQKTVSCFCVWSEFTLVAGLGVVAPLFALMFLFAPVFLLLDSFLSTQLRLLHMEKLLFSVEESAGVR